MEKIGKLSVEEIGLPTRVANALVKAGINTVEDLANADKSELIKVINLGEKSLKIISVALSEKGVKFEVEYQNQMFQRLLLLYPHQPVSILLADHIYSNQFQEFDC